MRKKLRQLSMLCLGLTALLLTGCGEERLEPAPYKVGTASTFRTPHMRGVPAENPIAAVPAPILPSPRAAQPARSVKVALLVPLSGPNAKLGNALLDAATLAVFDKYAGLGPTEITAQLELLPKDSGSTSATAAAATASALKEGAVLILGPVFATQIDAVAGPANKAGVNVISFSNNPAMARRGVYLLGFMADEQVDRVIRYAYERGAERIGAVLPTSPYGSAVAGAAAKSAASKGKKIEPVLFYPSGAGPESAVERLGEYVRAQPLQALFLAEGAGSVTPMVEALKRNRHINLGALKLLGTGAWDDPSLQVPSELAGAWFATSSPRLYSDFESRFSATYQYRPERIASLAYDAVALAATLALAPGGSDFGAAALSSPSGFEGPANGLFRFKPDGTNERRLAVVEITPQGLHEVDRAPRSF